MASTKIKPNRTYHHGGLRQALIAATREALEKADPETISLKGLSASLGVSQSAPYRHFANRETLLQTVAADGFNRLRAALTSADTEGTFEQVFERIAMAYIGFGQTNRGVYRLMFSSREICASTTNNSLATASAEAFDDLLHRVTTMSSKRAQLAIWIWATLHGIVMLDLEGLLGKSRYKAVLIEKTVHELASAVRARGKHSS